ncbi:hypothetical protein [Kitasatospora cineracea]|uniref:Uncharacterized protein n=1 Tax=Kitasatospora cineracea TaxID=88074 RepID=A0A8G1UR62_9ACTN|nr:hypothetical protein [Kitasatospora cineracea]ROR46202.1 hypothetical protein EDD39_4462 [Kitasatospora cineracea]
MANEVPFRGADREHLAELALRAAAGLPPVEAGVRLAFQVEEVGDWLVGNGFVPLAEGPDGPSATVDFRRAMDRLGRPRQAGRAAARDVLGDRAKAVLTVAAGLAGVRTGPLRHAIEGLTHREARLVAEAVMHAAGFPDASANPYGRAETSG